jgi:hypothetical protein
MRRPFCLALSMLALSLAGCVAMPKSALPSSWQSTAVIYLVRRSWHIDIGFSASDLDPPLKSMGAGFAGARFLLFGFGDRRYLQSKSKRVPNMLGALWPGQGLLLMTGLAGTPAQAFGTGEIITLPVSAQQLRAAQTAILASVALRDGAPISDGPGPYPGSAYWRAIQTYSAFHTCNTWAAETLKAASFPVRSTGVIFAAQLWEQARRISASGE